MESLIITQEQAVALAEKHGASVVSIHPGKSILLIGHQLEAMLNDHRQQVIEQLADQPVAMPTVVHLEWCRAYEVREAIAILEAKYDQAHSAWYELLGTHHKLQQAEARVAQLEKDAAIVDWIARQGDEFTSYILQDQPGDGDYYVSGAFKSGQGATFRSACLDAMNKESGE